MNYFSFTCIINEFMKWAHKIQQDILMFKEPEEQIMKYYLFANTTLLCHSLSKKYIGENWLEINSNFVLIHLIMVARI